MKGTTFHAWHDCPPGVCADGMDERGNLCSLSGAYNLPKTLRTYLLKRETYTGALVFLKCAVDYETLADFAIRGPMLDPTLKPGRVRHILGDWEGETPNGEPFHSLDSLALDLYRAEAERRGIPVVTVGDVVGLDTF